MEICFRRRMVVFSACLSLQSVRLSEMQKEVLEYLRMHSSSININLHKCRSQALIFGYVSCNSTHDGSKSKLLNIFGIGFSIISHQVQSALRDFSSTRSETNVREFFGSSMSRKYDFENILWSPF